MDINKAYEILKDTITKYNLNWTFESMDFVLNVEGISFDDLKHRDNNNKNIRVLLQSGLESKSKKEAFEVMQYLASQGLTPARMHKAVVKYMEEICFFSDTTENQMEVKEKLQIASTLWSQLSLLKDASTKETLKTE